MAAVVGVAAAAKTVRGNMVILNEQHTTNRRYYVVDVVFEDSKTLKMSF
jgi:hypothetical protein